jgi:hypothetical protein
MNFDDYIARDRAEWFDREFDEPRECPDCGYNVEAGECACSQPPARSIGHGVAVALMVLGVVVIGAIALGIWS